MAKTALLVWLMVQIVCVSSQPGALGNCRAVDSAKKDDQHVQALVDAVKTQAVKMMQAAGWNGIGRTMVAKAYCYQNVKGKNYVAKVKVDDIAYMHLRIYESIDENAEPKCTGIHAASKNDKIIDDFGPEDFHIEVDGPPGALGHCHHVNPKNKDDQHLQALVDDVKPSAVRMMQAAGWNGIGQTMVAKAYCYQQVQGLNYVAKVKVDDAMYMHVRIYEDIDENQFPRCTGVHEAGKDDKIIDDFSPRGHELHI